MAERKWVKCSKHSPCVVCGGDGGWCKRSVDAAGGEYFWCGPSGGLQVPGFRKLNFPCKDGGIYKAEGDTRRAGLMSPGEREKEREQKEAKFFADVKEAREAYWDGVKGGAGGGGARVSTDHVAVDDYFRRRGIDVAALPGGRAPDCLRLVLKGEFWVRDPANASKGRRKDGPCVVAKAVNGRGQFQGVHRIYLDPIEFDQKCAAVKRRDSENVKLFLGPMKGAAVRLRERSECGRLILTEGIETGLAVLAAFAKESSPLPAVWSVIAGNGFVGLELPAEAVGTNAAPGWVREIVIAADHDEPKPVFRRGGEKRIPEDVEDYRPWPGRTYARMGANHLAARYPWVRVTIALPDAAAAPALIGQGRGAGADLGFGEVVLKECDAGWGSGEILLRNGEGKRLKSIDWEDVGVKVGSAAVVAGMERGLVVSEGNPAGDRRATIAAIESALSESNIDDAIAKLTPSTAGPPGGGPPPPPTTPSGSGSEGPIAARGSLARARQMLTSEFEPALAAGERYTLVYEFSTESWMRWIGTRYEEITGEQVRARVAGHFEPYRIRLKPRKGEDEDKPRFQKLGLTSSGAGDIANMLQVDAGVSVDELPVFAPPQFDAEGVPLWHEKARGGRSQRISDPKDVIATRSGLLSLDAWIAGEVEVLPHTPRYLSTSCLPFELPVDDLKAMLRDDPLLEERGGALVARLAPTWVGRVVPSMSDSCEKWAECLGRCFAATAARLSWLEKMVYMPGPPGSFKGTTGEALKAAIGEELVGSTSLMEICNQFELSSWRGLYAVLMTDASLGRYVDAVFAVEQVKKLSGGDATGMTVKHQTKDATWRPRTMLWIMANELLALPDPSLSLSRRLVCLPTAGGSNERGNVDDSSIKEAVKAEGAGILIWALCHLRALMADVKAKRPALISPPAGLESLARMKRLSSRPYAFAQDCLILGPEEECKTGLLRDLHEAWCEYEGFNVPHAEKFGEQLHAFLPNLKKVERQVRGVTTKVYRGLRPRLLGEDPADESTIASGQRVMDSGNLAEFGFEFPLGASYGSAGQAPHPHAHEDPQRFLK